MRHFHKVIVLLFYLRFSNTGGFMYRLGTGRERETEATVQYLQERKISKPPK